MLFWMRPQVGDCAMNTAVQKVRWTLILRKTFGWRLDIRMVKRLNERLKSSPQQKIPFHRSEEACQAAIAADIS
jgi:hypothetical protein